MAQITPRWEWRTFGDSFGIADERFDALEASPVHVSEEIYYLAPGGDIVKLRDGLLDIKTLQAVHPEGGLEQWIPILKAEFPLSPDAIAAARASLRQPPPDPPAAAGSVEELSAALTAGDSGVLAVPVTKRRYRYTVGGCMAERSEVDVAGHTRRTIAVEDPDPEKVLAAVRELGLGSYLNTNYVAGLPGVLTDAAARYAVIDVGTNSVKLHVSERSPDGKWHRVIDRAVITRLGEGLEPGGEIGPAPLERTASVVAKMVAEARQAGAVAVAAVGTAGLRMAANGADAVATIERRAGIPVEVISGEEESRLAYLGATAGIARTGTVVVFDTGGGSSQFTFGTRSAVAERFSLDVGAVRFTEQYGLAGAVSAETVDEARAAIAAELGALAGRERPSALVGMGGALTNMTAVALSLAPYDPDRVHGAELTRDEVDRQIELFRSSDAEGRRSIVGLQPDRAEVILAGACIVRTVMDQLGCDALTVSDRGLRHGVLLERFGATQRAKVRADERRRPMSTDAPRKPRRTTPARAKKAATTAGGPAPDGGDGAGGPTATSKASASATAPESSAATTASNGDAAPRLSDADLATLLDLIKGVDSVELKLTVPASAQRATIRGLPIDPVEAQPRQVFFFDTPDLRLFKAGVVVRARRIQGGAGDTVVKLRPVVPDDLPEEIRNDPSFKTEVDVVPGGFVCSGSFKGKSTGQAIRNAVAGKSPLRKLFSKAQRAFYAEHAPEGLELDALVPLGPTFILKGTFTPKELKRRVTAEVWLYPDGSRILELSTKATPAEAFQVAAETRAYLSKAGVQLGGAQEPKTRAALEFYATQAQAAAEPAAT
jgi:exopolyphosphatase/guanosine-5'-triphosphate,3'-diphosphate pyrophosphatase